MLSSGAGSLMQVEFDDGVALALSGAGGSLVVDVPDAARRAGAQVLVAGWAKLTVPPPPHAAPRRQVTPVFVVQVADGTAVVHVDERGAELFVERGSAAVLSHALSGGREVIVPEGQAYTREAQAPRHRVNRRPAKSFVDAVPVPFRDTLPSLRGEFAGRAPPSLVPAVAGAPEAAASPGSLPELRRCMSDVTVRHVQEALQRLGIAAGPADGVAGPRTEAALREFQAQYGLPPSGTLDAETLRAIDDADRRRADAPPD
jgi:hypothetical protein